MKDDAIRLGKNLRKIRTEKKITQIEIAKRLDVDRSFISNIENGKSNSTLSTITSLAKALEVPTSELLK